MRSELSPITCLISEPFASYKSALVQLYIVAQWVEKVSERVTELVLPFSTVSENREEPFTKEIERAAVFCLAELGREKGGGIVVKKPPESLTFIAEAFYPFWLVAPSEISLLFDGLSTVAYTFTHSTIPDTKIFLENVERSSSTRQAYTAFLSDNLNYFQASGNDENRIMDGLITDHEFVSGLVSSLSEAKQINHESLSRVKIAPTLNEQSIMSTKEELQNLRLKLAEEVDALCTCMKLVKTKTSKFTQTIRNEIRTIEREYDSKIEERKASIEGEVAEMRKESDEKVTECSKEAEQELLFLEQEKVKLEKTIEQLAREVERCEMEIKTFAVSKDSLTETKWKEKRKETKSQLSEAETKLKEIEKKINEVKDERNLKFFELKSECDKKAKEAMKDVVEIESSRDARIRICKEEIERLEELSSTVINQIDNLVKMREKSADDFDKLGIRQEQKKTTLIHVPFYLACYQSDSGKRYTTFPPSTVGNVSLSVKFKGALGKAKIRQLLQPRGKKLTSFLNRFPLIMQQDAVFNREVNEACVEANILTKNSQGLIRTGLEKLKEAGWFSEKEHESLNEMLH